MNSEVNILLKDQKEGTRELRVHISSGDASHLPKQSALLAFVELVSEGLLSFPYVGFLLRYECVVLALPKRRKEKRWFHVSILTLCSCWSFSPEQGKGDPIFPAPVLVAVRALLGFSFHAHMMVQLYVSSYFRSNVRITSLFPKSSLLGCAPHSMYLPALLSLQALYSAFTFLSYFRFLRPNLVTAIFPQISSPAQYSFPSSMMSSF